MFRLTARPTIISVSFWGSVSAVWTVPMYLPLRRTATRSERAMTSWSLWVMITMGLAVGAHVAQDGEELFRLLGGKDGGGLIQNQDVRPR